MRLFTSLCFGLAAFCAILLLPLTVLAIDTAVAEAAIVAEANPWWHIVLVNVLIGLGSVVLGLIGRGLTLLFDWIAEKTNCSFLARVDDMAMDAITYIYTAEVEHAKAAVKDGKLSQEEKDRFASLACASIKQWLGSKALIKLGKLFNGSADDVIKAKVEKAVAVAKNAGKMARSSAIAKALGAAEDPLASSVSRR